MMHRLLLLALGAAAALGGAPVPQRPDGHELHPHVPGLIVLEAFYDFACSDCKKAHPVVQEVLQYYGPRKVRGAFPPPLSPAL